MLCAGFAHYAASAHVSVGRKRFAEPRRERLRGVIPDHRFVIVRHLEGLYDVLKILVPHVVPSLAHPVHAQPVSCLISGGRDIPVLPQSR